MSTRFWTKTRLNDAKRVLKKHSYISDAAQELSDLFGETVTPGTLSYALPEYLNMRPGDLLKDPDNKYKKRWWTKERIEKAKKILAESKTLYSAVLRMQKEFKKAISEDSLRTAFMRHEGNGNLMVYLKKGKRKKKLDEKEEDINLIVAILKKHKSLKPAMKELKNKVGIGTTSLRKILKKQFGQTASPGEFLRGSITQVEEENEQIEAMVKLIQKKTKSRHNKFITFRELCDIMDLSPGKVENLIEEGKALGYTLNISGDVLYLDTATNKEQKQIHKISIPKREENKITIAAIADTHCGSKHCMKEEIKHFVNLCYNDYGITTIFHGGDCLAGNRVYRGQVSELEEWSAQGQCEIFAETLPQLKGLQYIAILGNHDIDFIKSNGVDPAFIINNLRKDVKFLGNIKGKCILGDSNLELELVHIRSSAHARSYSLEKFIHKQTSRDNHPDILMAGHRHINGFFEIQGIQAFLLPCFEAETLFALYNTYFPSIGGLIVTFVLDDDNKLLRCEPSFRRYNLREQEKQIIPV